MIFAVAKIVYVDHFWLTGIINYFVLPKSSWMKDAENVCNFLYQSYIRKIEKKKNPAESPLMVALAKRIYI